MSNLDSSGNAMGTDTTSSRLGSTSGSKVSGVRGGSGGKKGTKAKAPTKKKGTTKKEEKDDKGDEGKSSNLLTVKRGGEATGQTQPGSRPGQSSFGTSGGKLMGIIEAEEKSGTPSLRSEGDSSNVDEE